MVDLVPQTVQQLLACPERLAMLRACAQDAGRPRAALDIAEAILRDVHAATRG